jgi:hypothetical protein
MSLRVHRFHDRLFSIRAGLFLILLLVYSNSIALEWAEETREPWFGDYDTGYEDGFRAGRSDSFEENRDYRRGGIPTRPTRENPWISAPQPGIRSEQDNPWADAHRFRSDSLRRDFDTRRPARDPGSRAYADEWRDEYRPPQGSYGRAPWTTDYGYQGYNVFQPLMPYGAPLMPVFPGNYGLYGTNPYLGTYPGYLGYPAIGSPFGLGWPGGLLWH